jgi:hypothetical protein
MDTARKIYDIFLCHSGYQDPLANSLAQWLEGQTENEDGSGQRLRVFNDSVSLRSGQLWNYEMLQAVEKSRCLICLVTPKFVESAYTSKEVSLALDRGIPIAPILCERLAPHDSGFRVFILSEFQMVDLSADPGSIASFKKILEEVRSRLKSREEAPADVPWFMNLGAVIEQAVRYLPADKTMTLEFQPGAGGEARAQRVSRIPVNFFEAAPLVVPKVGRIFARHDDGEQLLGCAWAAGGLELACARDVWARVSDALEMRRYVRFCPAGKNGHSETARVVEVLPTRDGVLPRLSCHAMAQLPQPAILAGEKPEPGSFGGLIEPGPEPNSLWQPIPVAIQIDSWIEPGKAKPEDPAVWLGSPLWNRLGEITGYLGGEREIFSAHPFWRR